MEKQIEVVKRMQDYIKNDTSEYIQGGEVSNDYDNSRMQLDPI